MTYSSTLALGRKGLYSERGRNSVAFKAPGRALGPISNSIILIVLALVLGMLYLAQATKTNAYGYRIASLQQEQSKLSAEYDDLQVVAARAQSVARVKDSKEAKALVAVAPAANLKP